MLGNPVDVNGRIQGNGEIWKGAPTFRVTSTYAQHVASGRGPGIDIGNGQGGAPVYSMAAGTVTFVGRLSTSLGLANVVRIWHPQLSAQFGGKRVESGYAHLAALETKVGVVVARGIAIGHVGKSGADAFHLHAGFKVGGSATVEGTEVDWWPLLDQNQGGNVTTIVEVVKFLGADGHPAPRAVGFQGPNTFIGYALDGSTEPYTLAAGKGSSAPADGRATISQSDNKAPKGSGWVRITAGVFADHPYLVEGQPGLTVAPDPAPPASGITPAELAAEKAKSKAEGVVEGATQRDQAWETKIASSHHP